MTKQITNNNNQISLSQRQALLYCLSIEKLDLGYCKAELDALRVDYLEFGNWNLQSLFAYISENKNESRTSSSRISILPNSNHIYLIYGNIIDINNQHNSISKPPLLNKINSQRLTKS